MYYQGKVNLKVVDENNNIKQEIDKTNTWTKEGNIFDYDISKYYIALINKDPLQRPYSNTTINNDYYGFMANTAKIGSILPLGYFSGFDRWSNCFYRSATLSPSWYIAGTFSGICLVMQMNTGSGYNSHGAGYNIPSIIRFDQDLVLLSSDNLIYSYYVYMSNTKI